MPNNPAFLDLDDILEIHRRQLNLFGGGTGIRDIKLLESAVAQPMASAFGNFVHEDLFAMAAAYLFHIVGNHAFVDGNKRTGLLAALVFLDVNGVSIDQPTDDLFRLTMDVANGTRHKAAVAAELRRLGGARG